MKLLMHICCSNCSIYPLQQLQKDGMSIYGLWYNPNIHPLSEYNERMDSLKTLQDEVGLDVEYIDDYGLIDFVRNVVGRETDRCEYCYYTRLEETAVKAKENGCDAFTSSLLVSPFQKFELLMKTGNEIAIKHDIEFLDRDFRSGYRIGREMAKEMGLYSQKYCGCIYSEMDRNRKRTK
ncbi:MAG: epoxyqueuosine reductase QueH [Nitrospirota bacterium]|nr:MAG: epoxyqueuosine reductase QueH [Nitrospirota bacterium]